MTACCARRLCAGTRPGRTCGTPSTMRCWRQTMPSRSLERRLDALEAKHAGPDRSAENAAAAETFRMKMDALIDRMEGRTADPATMSLAEQIACQFWTDPEGAMTRMQEAAQTARKQLEGNPQYRR